MALDDVGKERWRSDTQVVIDAIAETLNEMVKSGKENSPAVMVFALLKVGAEVGKILLETAEMKGGELLKQEQMKRLNQLAELFLAECRKGESLTDAEVQAIIGTEVAH